MKTRQTMGLFNGDWRGTERELSDICPHHARAGFLRYIKFHARFQSALTRNSLLGWALRSRVVKEVAHPAESRVCAFAMPSASPRALKLYAMLKNSKIQIFTSDRLICFSA